VLIAALRDLQWRRRRFTIAVLGTALVMAMTLLMNGVGAGFGAEATRTVDQLQVDGWVVATGSAGPFLGASPISPAAADLVAKTPGIRRAGAMLFTRKSVPSGSTELDVNIFGSPAGGPGTPSPDEGHMPKQNGEIAVSTTLKGYKVGDRILVAGHPFAIVGKVRRSTVLAGAPNVFLTLADAQLVGVAGQPVATSIAVEGTPTGPLPAGLTFVPTKKASADVLRAVAQARAGLVFTAVLLWIVAIAIVGAITYLSALERERDFAVFKATGVSSRSLFAGLALQAVLLSVTASLAGSVMAVILAPRFPMQVSMPASSHVALLGLAVVAGCAASLASIRRAAAVDPALAFGGP